jgi:hypothetical protein
MDNPFVTKGYAGPEYFCDRVEETKRIVELITNGNNMALISPRRLGKTDLVQHCFQQQQIKNRYYTFHIDIYATDSLRDFVNVFGKAVLDELKPKGKVAWEKFLNSVRSLCPGITFDINNNPTWSIGLGEIVNPTVTLDEIFQYLNQADKPCLVAIDEFQQITEYKDASNLEALLRTHIQRCVNATFLFVGSKRHLMGEIFTSPSRPFYQSVLIMNLKPINVEKYTEFARFQFKEHGKTIDDLVVPNIYERFDAVTSCIQRVLNVLFLKTSQNKTCTVDMVDGAIDYILDMLSETYNDLLDKIPEKQREVLIAIAKEGKVKGISGQPFIRKHHLQSVSVVTAAVRGLLDKDFITHDKSIYMVYDPFFALWLKKNC